MTEWTKDDEKEFQKVKSHLERHAFWSRHYMKVVYGLYIIACLGIVALVYASV